MPIFTFDLLGCDQDDDLIFGEIKISRNINIPHHATDQNASSSSNSFSYSSYSRGSRNTPLKMRVKEQSINKKDELNVLDYFYIAQDCKNRLVELNQEYCERYSSKNPNFTYLDEIEKVKEKLSECFETFFTKLSNTKNKENFIKELNAEQCIDCAVYLCLKKKYADSIQFLKEAEKKDPKIVHKHGFYFMIPYSMSGNINKALEYIKFITAPII